MAEAQALLKETEQLLRECFADGRLDAGEVLRIGVFAAEKVNSLKQMSGAEKKALVVATVRKAVEAVVPPSQFETAGCTAALQTLPAVLDIAVAAAHGKVALKKAVGGDCLMKIGLGIWGSCWGGKSDALREAAEAVRASVVEPQAVAAPEPAPAAPTVPEPAATAAPASATTPSLLALREALAAEKEVEAQAAEPLSPKPAVPAEKAEQPPPESTSQESDVPQEPQQKEESPVTQPPKEPSPQASEEASPQETRPPEETGTELPNTATDA